MSSSLAGSLTILEVVMTCEQSRRRAKAAEGHGLVKLLEKGRHDLASGPGEMGGLSARNGPCERDLGVERHGECTPRVERRESRRVRRVKCCSEKRRVMASMTQTQASPQHSHQPAIATVSRLSSFSFSALTRVLSGRIPTGPRNTPKTSYLVRNFRAIE